MRELVGGDVQVRGGGDELRADRDRRRHRRDRIEERSRRAPQPRPARRHAVRRPHCIRVVRAIARRAGVQGAAPAVHQCGEGTLVDRVHDGVVGGGAADCA